MYPTHKEISDPFCFDAFLSAIYISAMKKDMAYVIFEAMIDVICKQHEIYITPNNVVSLIFMIALLFNSANTIIIYTIHS